MTKLEDLYLKYQILEQKLRDLRRKAPNAEIAGALDTILTMCGEIYESKEIIRRDDTGGDDPSKD